jgi:pyruvate/2-oxoglutarate dehydrogenase complex dihydrolipoamide dehydrogenase (E3) component
MARWTDHYNAVVVGGGPGGLVAAAGLAGLGARVALVEKHQMGGDCLNTGCVPSKALIASAHAARALRTAHLYGLTSREPEIDVGKVFERMRERRAGLAHHDSVERFESLGVRVFLGEPGVFTSHRTVQAGDHLLQADRFIIATGGRPAVPPIPGLRESPHFTNETFFDELAGGPPSLCIMGGGPIGVEMAQTFARLGVPTTVVEMSDRILVREDPDATAVVRQALEEDGAEILTGHKVTRVAAGNPALGSRAVHLTIQENTTGRTIERDFGALLVAVGRQPNVEGLGLESAGVAYSARDGITVDPYLRTTRKNVFAVGDVASPLKFTHVADAQARTVVRNVLIPWWPTRFDGAVVPWCTYTDPECAHVGHNEITARGAGLEPEVYRFDLAELDRPVVDDRASGFVKVLADRKGRILGATIVGRGAGDWIHEYVTAMKHGITLPQISGTIHAYPTYAEANRRPGDLFMKGKLTPTARKILGRRWGNPATAAR